MLDAPSSEAPAGSSPTGVQQSGPASDKAAQCSVIYDGDCAVCQSFYAWADARDPDGKLSFTTVQALGLAEALPAIDMRRASAAMAFHRPDGSVVYGARAVFLTLGQMPGAWGFVGRVVAWPLLSAVVSPMYVLFARYRHRLGWLVRR
jgi:predicted DCC family thiol-disulfide oxidoreductase YuxK